MCTQSLCSCTHNEFYLIKLTNDRCNNSNHETSIQIFNSCVSNVKRKTLSSQFRSHSWNHIERMIFRIVNKWTLFKCLEYSISFALSFTHSLALSVYRPLHVLALTEKPSLIYIYIWCSVRFIASGPAGYTCTNVSDTCKKKNHRWCDCGYVLAWNTR